MTCYNIYNYGKIFKNVFFFFLDNILNIYMPNIIVEIIVILDGARELMVFIIIIIEFNNARLDFLNIKIIHFDKKVKC